MNDLSSLFSTRIDAMLDKSRSIFFKNKKVLTYRVLIWNVHEKTFEASAVEFDNDNAALKLLVNELCIALNFRRS